jgi:tripartite-type tricarboxylate transporter receptor subunit TctC
MLNVLVQIGERRARDLQNVPLITELASNNTSRQVLGIYSGAIGLGRPLAFGPGVPTERVLVLREAFRRMMADPEFNREAASIGYEIDPIIGEDLQAIVTRLTKSPKDIVEQARRAMELSTP